MRYQIFGSLLLFTVISSLASAQWDSDRFLFEPQPQVPRLKPIKQNQMKEKKSPKSTQLLPEHPTQESVEIEIPISPERTPASRDLPKIKLGVQLGYVDLKSKSNFEELTFSKSSFSFGVKLSVPIAESSDITFGYISAPELGKFRSEQALVENTYKIELSDQVLDFGPVFRQTAFWGSGRASALSFQQINSLGISGHFNLPPQGKWMPLLSLQLFPLLLGSDMTVNGSISEIDWTSYLEIKSDRSFMINFGYEKIDLRNTSELGGSMNQGQLKVFFGYRLSTN